ncbi:uncharacterized protein [Drosophila kikkawai]|uniref:Uncharacterized protein n=1 Tax=Drosophila kikkawai TaxID=30033 RepID=A0A6P4I8Y7_DROKI|nr:uncharacterized protein LOC108072425 [Drosophila kikkawai]
MPSKKDSAKASKKGGVDAASKKLTADPATSTSMAEATADAPAAKEAKSSKKGKGKKK